MKTLVLEGVEMKLCPPCDTEKPLSEFSVDRAKKDGLRSWCRACEAARGKARESPDLLRMAADYLERWQSSKR